MEVELALAFIGVGIGIRTGVLVGCDDEYRQLFDAAAGATHRYQVPYLGIVSGCGPRPIQFSKTHTHKYTLYP